MSLLVQPRLVNDPTGDPGLYLDFRFARRAMLFDLGETTPLSPRELIRVSHAFISHAHMDHVAGFDQLLRLRLHQPQHLTLLGPPGCVDKVQKRLGSYSWNLLDETSIDFRLKAQSFDGNCILEAAEFRAREQFSRRDLPLPELPRGVVLSEQEFEISSVALDHGIPSLAFAFQQRQRINVWRTALDALGLPVGPWIDEAKQLLRDELADARVITIPGAGEVKLDVLRAEVFRTSPGQKFAYVTDVADTPSNRTQIIDLVRGADHLFIEAVFLDADRALAEGTRHLTARAAGEIARAAGVRHVTPFHHSARYENDTSLLAAEVSAAFNAT